MSTVVNYKECVKCGEDVFESMNTNTGETYEICMGCGAGFNSVMKDSGFDTENFGGFGSVHIVFNNTNGTYSPLSSPVDDEELDAFRSYIKDNEKDVNLSESYLLKFDEGKSIKEYYVPSLNDDGDVILNVSNEKPKVNSMEFVSVWDEEYVVDSIASLIAVSDDLTDVVREDVFKRINDWIESGGTFEDDYIKRQFWYAEQTLNR